MHLKSPARNAQESHEDRSNGLENHGVGTYPVLYGTYSPPNGNLLEECYIFSQNKRKVVILAGYKRHSEGKRMKNTIIGRHFEQEKLQRIYASSQSEFVAVCGRRRIGKTYLVREFFGKRICFAASGQANQPMRHQLRAFANSFPAGCVKHQPRDWFEAFNLLARYLETLTRERKVVFLDELPWMDTPKSDFVSSLEYFWNSWASNRRDIVLVVCGSATSWMMDKLINNHGGLHNRLTYRLLLKPFTLCETHEMFVSRGFLFSEYETAIAYMILGGVPFYLQMLESDKSLAANIDELLFSSNGYLRYEMDNLYTALFRKSEEYLKVIEALSCKRMGLSREEIVQQTKLPSGGTLTTVLKNLEACGFIRKYSCNRQGRRASMFQVVDFFTLFYYHFLKNGIGRDQHYWTSLQATSTFANWCGLTFELLVLTHVEQIKKKLGISGVITEEYAWVDREAGAQVDLIIDRQDKTANICEIKFTEEPYVITAEEEMKLRKRLAAVRTIPKLRSKSLQLTFVTCFGIAPGLHSGIVQNEVTLSDLMM